MLNGDHVTTEAGTGLVHTAPSHGLDDYFVCLKYGIELDNPVNGEGRYRSDVRGRPHCVGSQPRDYRMAARNGRLLADTKIEHSYAHCWRHKPR